MTDHESRLLAAIGALARVRAEASFLALTAVPEQGRRSPRGPARVLLQVAAAHPETLLDVVRES